MNYQIIFITTILSITLILSTISAEFVTLTPRNVFGQSLMSNNFDAESSGSPIMNLSNNGMTDDNIVEISTTTNTNSSSPTPSSNLTGTTPKVTVIDAINSTYAAPKGLDEDESERRIARGLRDRVNDVLHTIVASNATVITASTITNDFANETTATNNSTRLLEVIPDQVHTAFERIKALSQTTNPLLELHSDIHTICISNDTSLADCNVNIRIH
jgi:hypothetical protein